MAISRNQACPCGSGKKYKKCCMLKNSVIDLQKLKEERFYERKHVLTTMVTDFVWGKMNISDRKHLQAVFDKRTEHKVSENAKSMMFQFYTLFMHRFENGFRGIEWFYEETGNRLETEWRKMTETWIRLTFRLVHAIEMSDDIIVFEDMVTKKTYPVANIHGNVPSNLKQNDGTIGLLELNDGKYYFNGVKVFMGPKYVTQAKGKIASLMKETGLSYEEVMMEYTLEVLTAMLTEYKHSQFEEEDIPLLEELGLEHLPCYAEDFLSFYKEKTTGKKENTVRKYRESLHDLNEVLKRNQIVDLKEVDEETWKRLLAKEYYDMYESMTKTQITDFISTLKSYIQWMERKKQAMLWSGLADFLKEEESQFIHAVQLPNSFFPNRQGEFAIKMNELVKLVNSEIGKDGQKIEGIFEIVKRNKQSFRVVLLYSNHRELNGKQYTISGADVQMEFVDEGLIFTGKISNGQRNMWELLRIDEAYPRTARPFFSSLV